MRRKEVILAALELFLEREDPLEKAQRILTRSLKKVVPDRRDAATSINENKPLGQAASKEVAQQGDTNREATIESGANKTAASKAAVQQSGASKEVASAAS